MIYSNNNIINYLVESLPEKWEVIIQIKNNSSSVMVVRPDNSKIIFNDRTINEALHMVMPLILDEVIESKVENYKL